MNIAVFGAGCFWCVEAIFSQLNGIESVVSGYSNGKTKKPTYESVCLGETGYAEVCKIKYNEKIISYKKLLEILFQVHNPTTLNRQGTDIGSQYRSAVFYTNKNQKEAAENYILELKLNKTFNDSIITEVTKLDNFHLAEDYHQNYYENNKNASYCKVIIKPKLDKLFK